MKILLTGLGLLVVTAGIASAQNNLGGMQLLNGNGTSDTTADVSPCMACSDSGTCVAVWTQVTTGNLGIVLMARSDDGGRSWAAPVPLDSAPGSLQARPSVVQGGDTWIAAWESRSETKDFQVDVDLLFSRSTDAGHSWSPPQNLRADDPADGVTEDQQVQLASDTNGKWVAVWQADTPADSLPAQPDIHSAYSTDDGVTWSIPQTVNPGATENNFDIHIAPAIATDGLGLWTCAWFHPDASPEQILISRSTDGGSTWSATPVALEQPQQVGLNRSLCLLYSGGTWLLGFHGYALHDPELGTDSEILLRRSTDDGSSWSIPVVINHFSRDEPEGTEGNLDSSIQLASDGDANLVAVWESTYNLGGTAGTDKDILVSMSDDLGVTWSEAQLLNNLPMEDDGVADATPTVAYAGSDRWVTAWQSPYDLAGETGTDEDIFANRFDSPGTPQGVYDFSVSPLFATPGDSVKIAFKVGRELNSPPVVTVNGAPATQVPGKSNSFEYEFNVMWLMNFGPATVLIEMTDTNGISHYYSNQLLHIVEEVPAAGGVGLALVGAALTLVGLRRLGGWRKSTH